MEQYEKCTDSPFTAFTSQAGIAVGNITALAPFLVLALLTCLGIFQYITGIRIQKDAYTQKEKEDALDAFAESLLVTRDVYFKNYTICSKYEIAPTGMINSNIALWSEEAKARLKDYFIRNVFESSMTDTFLKLVKELEIEAKSKAKSNEEESSSSTTGSPMHTDQSEDGNEMQTKSEAFFLEGKELTMSLVLVLNNPVVAYVRASMAPSAKIVKETMSRVGIKTQNSNSSMVLSDALSSYQDWFAAVSALNFKFSQLLEFKQKSSTYIESFEEKYWTLVDETNYLSTRPYAAIEELTYADDDHLLYFLLVSLMEVHACLALQVYDRTKVRTQYKSIVGYRFRDEVLSLADVIERSPENTANIDR